MEYLRFHDLRHTFATTALQNGIDVKTVSSMLGHFDAGFTLRTYTHATRQKTGRALPKPWVTLWNRSCKDRKKNTPDRKAGFLSGALVSIVSVVSFPRVGHGVGQKFLANPVKVTFCNKKIPENRSFSGEFLGAATQIRTGDLILTNCGRVRFSAFRTFCILFRLASHSLWHAYVHRFRPLVSPCGSRCGSKVPDLLQELRQHIKDDGTDHDPVGCPHSDAPAGAAVGNFDPTEFPDGLS